MRERRVAGLGRDELGFLAQPVLVELRLHERERERRRHHRFDVHLAQQVRQPADVILVAVRQDDGSDVPTLEVADVGQQEVDAEMLVAREGEPGVHDDDLACGLVHGHVLPDLAEAAERDDSQAFAHPLSLRPSLAGAPGYAATGARSPSRSRQSRTASRSSSVASTSGRR